jgi:hypothetical protein
MHGGVARQEAVLTREDLRGAVEHVINKFRCMRGVVLNSNMMHLKRTRPRIYTFGPEERHHQPLATLINQIVPAGHDVRTGWATPAARAEVCALPLLSHAEAARRLGAWRR